MTTTEDASAFTPLVLHGDADVLIQDIPHESVHAIVCDPPYGLDIGRLSGQRWDRDDTIAFQRSFWVKARAALKPGGLLIAFGASRTWHRLATAIEDADFRIEETILAWTRADKKLVDTDLSKQFAALGEHDLAAQFSDCHTMFKPATEPIVVARKPYEYGFTRIQNLRKHETGFLNFTDAYTPTDENLSRTPGAPKQGGVMFYDRGGSEKNVPHAGGRYPHNMVFIHDDACVPGSCVPTCAAAAYDHEHPGKSRYFRSFYHSGRTPQSERITVNGKAHLTVKPVSIMEWLVGIATLPGQTVLDPFAGSGSTGVAARNLGRKSVLIEREAAFADIARERAAYITPEENV